MSERKDRSDGMSSELADLKREIERERRLMLLGWAIGCVVAGLYHLVQWWLA